eukprot:6652505-Karenia_brevis.AAC.1
MDGSHGYPTQPMPGIGHVPPPPQPFGMQNSTEHYSFDDTTNPDDDDSDTFSDPGDEEHPDVDFT